MSITRYDDELLDVINNAEILELRDNYNNYCDEWKTLDLIESVFKEINETLLKCKDMEDSICEYIRNGHEMSSKAETIDFTAPSLDEIDAVNRIAGERGKAEGNFKQKVAEEEARKTAEE